MARRIISEALKNTIEGMLLSGKTTVDIIYETGVSSPTIRKIRENLIRRGYGELWHTSEYLDSKGWA